MRRGHVTHDRWDASSLGTLAARGRRRSSSGTFLCQLSTCAAGIRMRTWRGKGCASTPPSIVQTRGIRARNEGARANAEHDADLALLDLDRLHQRPNDTTLAR